MAGCAAPTAWARFDPVSASLSSTPEKLLKGPVSQKPQSFWDGFVRAARPTAIWVCVGTMFVRGMVQPIIQLVTRQPVDPLDWVAFSATIGAVSLSALRSYDKKQGTA